MKKSMWYYVYVLRSKKDMKFYTGYTKNLKLRLELKSYLTGFTLGVVAWMFAAVSVSGALAQGQENLGIVPIPEDKSLRVHLEGVYSAKISLTPFEGRQATKPLGEVVVIASEAKQSQEEIASPPSGVRNDSDASVRNDAVAQIKVPAEYLPGEFLLRLDYRAQESSSLYPAEKVIFINEQDIEVFVNPITGVTRFGPAETENTAYDAFRKENNRRRPSIDLLRQFLLGYDRTGSKFYVQAVKEFEQRRAEYNRWLSNQAKADQGLYVSRLFQFQYIPAMPPTTWSGSEAERFNQLIKHYFDGIDFSDPLIIGSRELSRFMDGYMRLYAMQARTKEQRDSLFIQAGRVACEKASQGHPKVYGWMVDYFYKGYETYGIKEGMAMLAEHIDNPNCLASKKEQISKRLESMARLAPGALAPNFVISDNQGNDFEFHKWKGKARYKLLLFWSAECGPCKRLISGLRRWYSEPVNKEKLDIIAVNLDQTENGVRKWKTAIAGLPEWKQLRAQGGVNSPVANNYAILSTPAMFLIESESNIIVSVPGSLEQLLKDLQSSNN